MKKTYENLEIAFWDFITPLLSESATVRWMFRTGADLVIEKKKMLIPLAVLPWAGIGLLAGFIIGRAGLLH